MGKGTGHGATISFSSSGFTGAIRSIAAVENEMEKVEDTTLSDDDFKTYIPGDVSEPGDFELTVAIDNEDAVPALGTVETITITAPLQTGQSAAASCAGTGFIRKRTISPEYGTNKLQEAKLMVSFDGKTGPAHTPAVAVI